MGCEVGRGLLRPALGTSGASAPSPHVKVRGAAQGELLGVGPCDRVSLVGVLPTGARSPGGTSAQSPGLLGYAASGCGQGRANCGGQGPGGAGAAPSRPRRGRLRGGNGLPAAWEEGGKERAGDRILAEGDGLSLQTLAALPPPASAPRPRGAGSCVPSPLGPPALTPAQALGAQDKAHLQAAQPRPRGPGRWRRVRSQAPGPEKVRSRTPARGPWCLSA